MDWKTAAEPGEHIIRQFQHRYAHKDYEVKFIYVISHRPADNSDSDSHGWNHPHYRIDVIPTHSHEHHDQPATAYIRFTKPPQKISWMLYYLRETLAVYLKADKHTIDYPALLHPQGGEEGFTARMLQLELEY